MRARIYRSAKRLFDCKILDSGQIVQATALASLIKSKDDHLVVGDYVELQIEKSGGHIITEIIERENEVFRLIKREQRKKVIASNCDVLILIQSISRPKYKRGLVDRYLARSLEWGIRPLVVFNKMDEYDEQLDLKFEAERLQGLGVQSYEISAKDHHYEHQFLDNSLEQLKKDLIGKTAILLGQSGVGKSKTVAAITDGRVVLLTKKIAKVGKGSHTTTWAELIDCGDFELIDSPGIRSFAMEDLMSSDLLSLFPDIEQVSLGCKFKDCEHDESSKGCAFYKDDLNQREKELIHSRLESFIKIREEVAKTPEWKKSKRS